ncbi:MAG TPA: hypothetical protein VE953_10995 [Terriglobales bacterium]|nr:hypothetical protein [Terriglobales bacterium]
MPLENPRPPDDSIAERHESRIKEHAQAFADSELDYVDRLLHRLLEFNAFWMLGTALTVDTGGKTVTVRTDPIAGPGGAPRPQTLTVKFGRESWTKAQLEGQRVRIGWEPLLSYGWIIDVAKNE